jgi:hypothetical protein
LFFNNKKLTDDHENILKLGILSDSRLNDVSNGGEKKDVVAGLFGSCKGTGLCPAGRLGIDESIL